MLKHNANFFYFTTRGLYQLQQKVGGEIKNPERGGMSPLTRQEIELTRKLIEQIRRDCTPIGLFDVLNNLYRFDGERLEPFRGTPFTLEQLRVELERLSEEIALSLGAKVFLVIPPDV